MNEALPFKLFASCRAVKGYMRSTVCDLQRNRIHLVPQALYDILSRMQGTTISEVKAACGYQHSACIDEYFAFLLEEELIFFTTAPESFPDIDLQWHYPFDIHHCVIDLGPASAPDWTAIFASLDQLSCRYLEVRSYTSLPLEVFRAMMAAAQHTTITGINLITAYQEHCSIADWMHFCDEHMRLSGLTLHSCPQSRQEASPRYSVPLIQTTKVLDNERCCGVINERYFISHTEVFTEALQHNTCLNRKISIDAEGNIKNCPSMKESFGNIRDTTLAEALHKPGFKKYWNITKDQISICKDCEFRYVCTDCRAYLEQPDDMYSKPLKCGYDPYTCTWAEWSSHPMKQAAIACYEL